MSTRLDRLLTGALLLVALYFCLFKLTHPDLQMWDEADNIGVLLESLDAGSPIHLQRFGQPYFDKPHLWYYLTEAAILLLGRQELAFRLVSAISGFLLIAAVILAARRFFSPVAGLAAGLFMLAVRQNFIFRPAEVFSTHHLRSADSDALLILCLFGAFVMLALRAEGWRPGLPLAGLLTALGLLAKGPLALVPAASFVVFQAISPRRASLTLREIVLAVAVFAAVALPWHIYMALTAGEAFHERYVAYVAGRVTAGLPGHAPGPGYYLRILTTRRLFFGAELSLAAVLALATVRRERWRFTRAGSLLTLALIALVLQSSRTKIAWYVLPLYPFLALAVGALAADLERLARLATSGATRRLAAASLAVLFVVCAPFAAHNAYSLARLSRGPVQTFFAAASEVCGEDLVYADGRENVHIRYLLLRHGLERGPAGASDCIIARTDTEGAPGGTEGWRELARGGGFVLWRRVNAGGGAAGA